jgi:arylamine N-acetyltransferase
MLTSQQVDEYLRRLSLSTREPPSLRHLNDLIRCQLNSVPYENLSIHYSETHSLALDIPSLFTKIVSKGQGGYCMELNALFAALLVALGFDVRRRAGRVWKAGSRNGPEGETTSNHWAGWNHMILIIHLDGEYLVDVGFGSNGPVKAMAIPPPWTAGEIIEGVIPEEHQLGTINAPHSPSEWLYILRHRRDSKSPWTPLFTFDPLTPFSTSDYEIMSFHCHCHPSSPFVSSLLCTTVGFDEDGNAITRTLLQNNVLKERRGGETKVVEKLDSEEARLIVIQKRWGIKFTDVERKEVKKWGVGIVGPADEKSIPMAGWS